MNEKTRSRAWAVITTVLAVVFSYVAFTVWDNLEAHGAELTTAAAAAPDEPQKGPMVRHEDPKTWGRQMAADFRRNEIDDSAGRGIPRKISRALARYAARKAQQGIRVQNWWSSGGMDQNLCMAAWGWAGGTGWCLQNGHKPRVARINREIVKVTVICGGAAVIGSVKGGGWVGAGRGAVGCAWARWATAASD